MFFTQQQRTFIISGMLCYLCIFVCLFLKEMDVFQIKLILRKRALQVLHWGGTQIIFWQSVRPEVWNPYPYLGIFLTQKPAE